MSRFDHVTFDPGQEIFQHDIEDVRACLPEVDILIVNEHEYNHFEERYQEPVDQYVEPEGTLEALVVSRGGEGCEVRTPDREFTVPAVSAEVADPSGAGDAHRAGMVMGLSHGLDLVQSLQFAATLSSFVVEQNGAQESLPSTENIRVRHEDVWDCWPF